MSDKQPGIGEAVQKIVDLAKESDGDVNTRLIEVGRPGLPAKIVVGHRQGPNPQFFDLLPVLEKWRVAPERRTGTAKAATLQSFIDLVNRHKDEGSVLFGRAADPASLLAIIDYHDLDNQPRWGQHRIHYAFPLTDEFKTWTKGAGVAMPQADFAEFLENSVADLALATADERALYEDLFRTKFASPAELLTLSRGLEVRVESKIKHSVRLASGEMQLVYETENRNERGEPLTVPGLFLISIPAFEGGEPIRIPARLSYRARESVTWKYDLYKWQAALQARVRADLALAAEETALPAYEGQPET